MPPTTDVAAVKLFFGSPVSPGMVATQGTAVGSAIRTCWTGFDENSEASRTVVVLTDGENHEDDVVAAAAEVAQEGGNVHFLGLATLEGAPIPAFDARGNPSVPDGPAGNAVVSKLDEAALNRGRPSRTRHLHPGRHRVCGPLLPDSIQKRVDHCPRGRSELRGL